MSRHNALVDFSRLWIQIIDVIKANLNNPSDVESFVNNLLDIQKQVDELDNGFDGLTPIDVLCPGVMLTLLLGWIGEDISDDRRQSVLTETYNDLNRVFQEERGVFVPDVEATTFGDIRPIIRKGRVIPPAISQFLQLDSKLRSGTAEIGGVIARQCISLLPDLNNNSIVEVMCLNAIYALIPWWPVRQLYPERQARLMSGNYRLEEREQTEYASWAKRITGDEITRCRVLVTPSFRSICFLP